MSPENRIANNFGYNPDEGGTLYQQMDPSDGNSPGGEEDVSDEYLTMSRDDSAGETIYELALPWDMVAPTSPDDDGFAMTVIINERDEASREGWVQWGDGVGSLNVPGEFRPVQFEG